MLSLANSILTPRTEACRGPDTLSDHLCSVRAPAQGAPLSRHVRAPQCVSCFPGTGGGHEADNICAQGPRAPNSHGVLHTVLFLESSWGLCFPSCPHTDWERMVVVLKIRGSLERNEPAPGREARGEPTGLPDTGGAGFPGCSSEEVRAALFLWFRNYCCSDARRFPAERIITRNGKTFNFLANSTVFWGSVLGSAFCRKKGSRSLGTHRRVRAVTPLTDGMCAETLAS